jgi:osmoprotectant transport system substrate-binding protein
MKLRWTYGPLALLLLIPALVACGPFGDDDDAVTIGSKNFTEQLILGEIYALLLEDRGYDVERSLNLGGTSIAHEALVAGNIDLYPEYTGTGLLAILNMETMSDPDEVYRIVSEEYAERYDLIWLDQAPMNNANALATSQEFSAEHNMTTISDMVAMADQIRLAAVPDFEERDDGLAGLKEVYGDFELQELVVVDPGIKYQAFLQGDADVVQVFGTDGQIAGYDLVVLDDDKGLWPPYRVAPVIRQDTLDDDPEIGEILNSVQPLLTSEVMTAMNWAVEGPDQREPEDVAREFLIEHGLIDD